MRAKTTRSTWWTASTNLSWILRWGQLRSTDSRRTSGGVAAQLYTFDDTAGNVFDSQITPTLASEDIEAASPTTDGSIHAGSGWLECRRALLFAAAIVLINGMSLQASSIMTSYGRRRMLGRGVQIRGRAGNVFGTRRNPHSRRRHL
jgi:hypothetical protein